VIRQYRKSQILVLLSYENEVDQTMSKDQPARVGRQRSIDRLTAVTDRQTDAHHRGLKPPSTTCCRRAETSRQFVNFGVWNISSTLVRQVEPQVLGPSSRAVRLVRTCRCED